MTRRFLNRLLDDASRAYRDGGRFAYHFARGKLGGDNIFRELLQRGVFPPAARFLDLGCGQAVFASWLLAARRLYERGDWPADWPQPPRVLELRGYELMPKDVARARAVFANDDATVRILQGDIRAVDFGRADVITILDVLQYIDFARQEDILRRVHAALPAGGVFVTRIGDADAGLPFHLCNWVDHAVTFVRGHRLPQLYTRSLGEWTALLRAIGFEVDSAPMSGRKPFANTMLVARVAVSGTTASAAPDIAVAA
ncbi:MAG: class I SAM-dependent methyltransferase [Rhodocyclales bacterium]|nr:class I SAM-dependent methyltransferase [Rhodocyclales bacterium]